MWCHKAEQRITRFYLKGKKEKPMQGCLIKVASPVDHICCAPPGSFEVPSKRYLRTVCPRAKEEAFIMGCSFPLVMGSLEALLPQASCCPCRAGACRWPKLQPQRSPSGGNRVKPARNWLPKECLLLRWVPEELEWCTRGFQFGWYPRLMPNNPVPFPNLHHS